MRTDTATTVDDPTSPCCSIVIPAYNAAETLGACLDASLSQSVRLDRYEIIVVDDGSMDGTADIARRHGVRVLSQTQQGPAAARNTGLRSARADIVLFTDADCIPAPTWIEEMVASLADPEVVGVRGTYRTHQRELVARFVQIEYEDRYDRMRPGARIDFIDTYSAGYRRTILLTNGGFNTAFRGPSVEDQELSFRLARKGYRLVFAPRAAVYHRHDRSCWEYAARKFNIGYWKALLAHWYPERMVTDSHTPQVLKFQMAVMAAALLVLLAAPLWRGSLWLAAGFLFLFMCTALPFLLKAARKDPEVALASPLLLMVRAIALGAGFGLGQLHYALSRGNYNTLSIPTSRSKGGITSGSCDPSQTK